MCAQSNVECEIVTDKAPRGPKKGYLQALKTRIALLESKLAFHDPACDIFDDISSERGASASTAMSPTVVPSSRGPDLLSQYSCNMFASNNIIPLDLGIYFPADTQSSHSQTHTASITPPGSSESFAFSPVAMESVGDVDFTYWQQAELDQLYFDRVQSSVPVLHQRRYLSWSRQDGKSVAQTALQYAVWMLAALVSPQSHTLYERLYDAAKRHVEISTKSSDANINTPQDIELVQAIILLSTYESMRGFYDMAWMSAGRALRMVQAMGLNKVDGAAQNPFLDQQDFIEKEELRRTFWMTYLLNNMFAIRGNWPAALRHNMIQTRLPMPESDFQNEQPAQTDFLMDAILEPIPQTRSPFSESIIFATICSQSHMESRSNGLEIPKEYMPSSWGYRQDSMAGGSPRMRLLWHYDPPPASSPDPMLILANLLAQLSVILLYRRFSQSCMRDSSISAQKWIDCQNRALVAAERIVDVVAELTNLHYSQVHPLLPIIMRLNADFLAANVTAVAAQRCLKRYMYELGSLCTFYGANTNYLEFLGMSNFLDDLAMATA